MDTKESQGRTPGFENAAPKKRAVLCQNQSLKINAILKIRLGFLCLSKQEKA